MNWVNSLGFPEVLDAGNNLRSLNESFASKSNDFPSNNEENESGNALNTNVFSVTMSY